MNTSAFPQTTLPMPLWLQGLVELGLKALGSYLTVLLLLLAIWYTRGLAGSSLWEAAAVAGHIWLLAHGVPLSMSIPQEGVFAAVEGSMSLVPLGLTFIPFILCYWSGRRLARASYEGQFWQPTVAGMLTYGLFAAGISLASSNPLLTTNPLSAFFLPQLLVLLGLLLGGYRESRSLAAMIGVNAAEWVKRFSQYSRWAGSYVWALLRAAWVAVLAFLAAGALLLTASLLLHWDAIISLYQSLGAGAVGDLALTLLQVGLIPNSIIYAVAWSSGAGFSLGQGTLVDLTQTKVGVMPSLPLLGALPQVQEPWGYVALALPVASGALAGWWFFREGENHLDEWFSLKIPYRWLSWPLSSLTSALLLTLPSFALLAALALVSRGSLGVGRFTDIGADPLLMGAFGAGLLGAGFFLGLGLAHLLVSDTSLDLERFAPAPAQEPADQARPFLVLADDLDEEEENQASAGQTGEHEKSADQAEETEASNQPTAQEAPAPSLVVKRPKSRSARRSKTSKKKKD